LGRICSGYAWAVESEAAFDAYVEALVGVMGHADRGRYGHEMGFEVMREYTAPKSIWVNVDAPLQPFYRR
jgi:hypothetical protein